MPNSLPQTLAGKRAIITGGTAGIGRATAELFVEHGAKVVVTGRDLERAKNIQPLIDQGHALFVQQDTSDEKSWADVISRTLEAYGGLDILVNNAGRLIVKPLPLLSHDDMKLMLAANLESVFLGMRAAWPHLTKTGGNIVNVSALMGAKTAAIGLAYSAAKAAQQALTKSAALEGAAHNIRVNTVLPGVIWSDGWKRLAGEKQDETKTSVSANIPLKRVGEPREIAQAIVYLAGDEARYITGIEMTIDGGSFAG
ncbi:MAG: SDR family oxidoreductase [Rhodospirillaceae bacterium]|nr:SDR family oxidoreductase [Rhodospirillaceae bacterium]